MPRLDVGAPVRHKILFLSQCLPYPPHSGATSRTFHILCQLQREFDVILLAYSRKNHQPTAAGREASRRALAERLSEVLEPVPIRSDRSPTTKLYNHLASLLTRRPFTYYEYASRAFATRLERILRERSVALVHADSLDLHRWFPRLPAVPRACTHHDIDSILFRRRAESQRYRPLARYLRLQAALLERLERDAAPRCDLNLLTSETDAERLRALAPAARLAVVPNGVDTGELRPEPADAALDGRVAFLGPTYMFANRDAVGWFLERVWPLVLARRPGATFRLIGSVGPRDREQFESAVNVGCLGRVDDVRPHLAAAACTVVPIRVGGGTRLKILDSWAVGRPVVSTSIGCEGLAARDGENLLVRDEPEAFAEAVLGVLDDRQLRLRLGLAGRKTAEERYSWDIVGRGLREAYRGLIDSRP